MALQHDSDGFLTGETVSDISRANDLLASIQSDISTIKRAVLGLNSGIGSDSAATSPVDLDFPEINIADAPHADGPVRADQTAEPAAEPVRIHQDDESATEHNRIERGVELAAEPVREEHAAERIQMQNATDYEAAAIRAEHLIEPVEPARSQQDSEHEYERIRTESAILPRGQQRDPSSGRFISQQERAGRFTSNTTDSDKDDQNSSFGDLADRIVNAISSTRDGVEDIDPVIKAFSEVAQPLAGGYQAISGSSKGNEKNNANWFKKIFRELSIFRKEDSVYNRAARRSLGNIEDNTEETNSGGGDSGSHGFFGALMGSITPKIMAVITGLMSMLGAAVSGIGPMLLSGLSAVFGVVFSPIGLAISAAALAAWGLFTEDGRQFFSGIGDKITAAWDGAVAWFTESSPKTVEMFNKVVDGILDLWKPIANFLKDKFGIVTQAFDKGVDKVNEVGNKANDFVKDKTGVDVKSEVKQAHEKAVKYTADNIIDPGTKAAERAYNATASSAGSALEKVMPGYRHKALFDNIKGGDSLTKNGSYTDEEAAKIRELKTSGANTSANVKGGMPIEIQDKISAQAKQHDLDPVMMQKIAAMESGGNANAVSSTGATGIYQFTGQTASGVGIKNRFDVDQNIEGGMKLTKQNSSVLEKSGLPVTAENLYMMHQLGPAAAKEVIMGAASGKSKADMSPSTQNSMNLNYGSNSKTATDYIAANKKALDDRYVDVTKNTGGEQIAGQLPESPEPSIGFTVKPHDNSKKPETPTAIASPAKEDPTQGGRYKFETLEGGKVQVTDNESGVTELASDEQSNAYRRQQGQAYKDQVAAINNPDSYRSAPVQDAISNPNSYISGQMPTAFTAAPTQTISAPSPKSPSIPSPPAITEAPPVMMPIASDSDRGGPLSVKVDKGDVGQDVSDRRIAHIVTGALSG